MKKIRDILMVISMITILLIATCFIAIVNILTDVYLYIFNEEKYKSRYGLNELEKDNFLFNVKVFAKNKMNKIKDSIKEFKRSWIKLG